jgi:hypothetical protein
VAGVMAKSTTKISESISVSIFGKNGSIGLPKKAFRLLVPELAALTLQTNQELMTILSKFKSVWTNRKLLPSDDQKWISEKIQKAPEGSHIRDSRTRITQLNEILNMKGPRYAELNESITTATEQLEHIALRAYPVRYLTPQAGACPGKRLLVVVYHLQGHWIFFHLAKFEPLWSTYNLHDMTISAKLISKKKWKVLMDRIVAVTQDFNKGNESQIVLHVPEESGLKAALLVHTKLVVDDMPKEYDGNDRLEIKVLVRASQQIQKRPFSFFKESDGQNTDQDSDNSTVSALPNLSRLTHAKKDELIKTLWKEIAALRQSQTKKKSTSQNETSR